MHACHAPCALNIWGGVVQSGACRTRRCSSVSGGGDCSRHGVLFCHTSVKVGHLTSEQHFGNSLQSGSIGSSNVECQNVFRSVSLSMLALCSRSTLGSIESKMNCLLLSASNKQSFENETKTYVKSPHRAGLSLPSHQPDVLFMHTVHDTVHFTFHILPYYLTLR